ncbi:MFS transporter [Nocardioides convexus]|uniref:MFS transporter n=1 Tax=Nocardioides convexus TaxID=2712224 RepID=UPI002418B79C|nr:MFS transporter [Nocardioides convexus]
MNLTSAPAAPGRTTPASGGFWPVALCWMAVALDGFDLVVLGAVIPTLSKTGALGFTDASLTTASTIGLVGVGIGAVAIGPLTDRFGRRTSLIASIAIFSVLTVAVAFAQDVTQFTILRFLAGLGLGACLPTALAYMSEHASAGRGGSAVTRMMTGYHVGAVLTALLGLWVIDAFGWEAMFVVGGVAGLLTLPVMWAKSARVRGLPPRRRYDAGRHGPAQRGRGPRPLPAGQPRPVGRLLHGPAARLRAQHLAAEDHGRGGLLHQGRHRPAPGAQRRRRDRPARGRRHLRLARQQAHGAGLVRPRGRLLGRAVDPARLLAARLRRRDAHRHLRVQRAGARLRLRRPPLPAGDPRHRARHVRGHRPGRRDRRALARRRPRHGRDRLPVGLLRLRGRRGAGGRRPGHRPRARAHRARDALTDAAGVGHCRACPATCPAPARPSPAGPSRSWRPSTTATAGSA